MTDTAPAVPAPPPGPGAVPAPPPGPGAVPPFPAPPVEGRAGRLRWGLGLGALALLLCCGGGGAAVAGLAVVASRAIDEQADVVVGGYLDAVRDKRFADAYAALCDQAQSDETQTEFTARVGEQPAIESYQVGDMALSSVEPVVPVQVVYRSGTAATLRVYLEQDRDTGQFEVCRVER